MKRITYICERCGVEKTNPEKIELWGVKVNLCDPLDGFEYAAKQGYLAKWCRQCCIDTGLLDASAEEPRKSTGAPHTLDELVREIVRDKMSV